jgi:hypothetical protein
LNSKLGASVLSSLGTAAENISGFGRDVTEFVGHAARATQHVIDLAAKF